MPPDPLKTETKPFQENRNTARIVAKPVPPRLQAARRTRVDTERSYTTCRADEFAVTAPFAPGTS